MFNALDHESLADFLKHHWIMVIIIGLILAAVMGWLPELIHGPSE